MPTEYVIFPDAELEVDMEIEVHPVIYVPAESPPVTAPTWGQLWPRPNPS